MAKKKKRTEQMFLNDILECIELIAEYIEGLTAEQFKNSSKEIDAIMRRIEIMGEAVKNISKETRKKYPDIPWRQIAGMRDIVIHNYFGVDEDMVWEVATKDIPALKDLVEQIIADLS